MTSAQPRIKKRGFIAGSDIIGNRSNCEDCARASIIHPTVSTLVLKGNLREKNCGGGHDGNDSAPTMVNKSLSLYQCHDGGRHCLCGLRRHQNCLCRRFLRFGGGCAGLFGTVCKPPHLEG